MTLSMFKLKGPNITLSPDIIKEIRGSLNISATNETNTKLREEFLKQLGDNFETKIRTQMFLQKSKHLDELESLQSESLLEKFAILQTDENYIKMQEFRQSLPTFFQKQIIVDAIRDNQVVLIKGATGSGKTTQICQYILDDALINSTGGSCRIICTQPRRLAATSIAERVAAERAQKLGNSVGYHIRLDKILPRESGGSILFCTTGVILKMLESDSSLSQYSHVFLDEVHERQVHTDVSLGVLKLVLKQRTDLKVILMSATLTVLQLSAYFDNCPVIEIPGVTFPVEEFFLEDVIKETQYFYFQEPKFGRKNDHDMKTEFDQLIRPYVNSIKDKYSTNVIKALLKMDSENGDIELVEELIFHISKNRPNGAILVFLPGYEQISKLLMKLQKSTRFPQDKFKIYPLHSLLTGSDQRSIFLRPPEGVRKVILSTQMAETSITIDDVVYVINSGKHKITQFNNQKNLNELQLTWLTKANAAQRRGRAGRVQPGVCYHLYSRGRANLLNDFETPEILRIRLEEVILSIKVLGIKDVKMFLNTLIDPPSEDVIIRSIDMLKRMDALSIDEELTPLGLHLAKLPVHPQIGKMILLSAIFSCVNPIATVAASLSFKSPFYHVMVDIIN